MRSPTFTPKPPYQPQAGLISIYIHIYIYVYLYIFRNIGGRSLRAPTGAISRKRGEFLLILAAFSKIKRPGRVVHAMGPN